MPHYYFHLYNELEVLDEEGLELADAVAAHARAIEEARALACASIQKGHLDLNHRIEIEDEAGNRTWLRFRDAFTLTE